MISALLTTLLVTAGPDPVLAEALSRLQKPTSVSARLEQVKTMRAFKRPQVAKGRLLVVPPRQIRWEYESPYRAILVIAGDRMSMSYPDLGRKQVFDLKNDPSMKQVIDTMLFFMEADANKVHERFVVAAKKGGDGRITLTLEPRSKQAAGFVAKIVAVVQLQAGVLESLTLTEPDGDSTRLTMSDIQTNQPVDKTLLVP